MSSIEKLGLRLGKNWHVTTNDISPCGPLKEAAKIKNKNSCVPNNNKRGSEKLKACSRVVWGDVWILALSTLILALFHTCAIPCSLFVAHNACTCNYRWKYTVYPFLFRTSTRLWSLKTTVNREEVCYSTNLYDIKLGTVLKHSKIAINRIG